MTNSRGVQPNKLRILGIIPSAFCFGLQNVTLAIFDQLARKHKCHFLITKWNNGEVPSRLQKLNIPYTGAWLGMFSRKLDWRNLRMTLECLIKLPSAYWVFVKVYRQFSPTTILLANHHEAILLWPVLIFVKRKVVCQIHDPPPAIPFQRLSFWWWRRVIGRFLFISHSAKTRMLQLGQLTSRDVVVWNGVAVDDLVLPRSRDNRFCQQFGWPADTVIVGLTGQMTPTKGHEDFIEAAAIVKRTDPRARFVIGGKPNEPFLPKLQQLVAKRDLENVMQFTGWLDTSREFFESIDVFALASRHDEGFGLVLAEAGERGLPSVATRSGGANEIIVDGQTGMLVPKSAPTEMAKAIEKLVREDKVREDMGRNARYRISEYFDLVRQSQKIEEVIAATN